MQGDPRVVGGHPGGVGAAGHSQAAVEHGAQRRGLGGGGRAVAVDEGLALEGEPVLHGDGAAERGDPVQAVGADGLGVVEQPAVALREQALGGELLEHGEVAADRLVVGGVQPEAPAVLHQHPHGLLELAFVRAELRARFGEVLEVGGGPGEVLAGAVEAQPLVALAGADGVDPALEVVEFLSGGLREQVVGDAERQLAAAGEFHDGAVVLREALEAAGGVDRGGQAEAVQLA